MCQRHRARHPRGQSDPRPGTAADPPAASLCASWGGRRLPTRMPPASGSRRPSFFDVRCGAQQGENCARYLSKGTPGRRRRPPGPAEWEAQDGTQAEQGRDHRQHGDVHRRARRRRFGERARWPAVASRRPRTWLRQTISKTSISAARTISRSRRLSGGAKKWHSPEDGGRGLLPGRAGGSTVTSAKRTSSRSTTKTTTCSGGSCRIGPRSARAAPLGRAAASASDSGGHQTGPGDRASSVPQPVGSRVRALRRGLP